MPWADCTDAQRLDVYSGLLLSALWDAAFDRGLISFADDGTVLAVSLLYPVRPMICLASTQLSASERPAGQKE